MLPTSSTPPSTCTWLARVVRAVLWLTRVLWWCCSNIVAPHERSNKLYRARDDPHVKRMLGKRSLAKARMPAPPSGSQGKQGRLGAPTLKAFLLRPTYQQLQKGIDPREELLKYDDKAKGTMFRLPCWCVSLCVV